STIDAFFYLLKLDDEPRLKAWLLARWMRPHCSNSCRPGKMKKNNPNRQSAEYMFERLAAVDEVSIALNPAGETPAVVTPAKRMILSSQQFVAGFVPPDYIVDGLLQQGFLYSLTGATGAGKTCITLRLAASVALGTI